MGGLVISLHSGLDTVGIISIGRFSKTYGVGEEANLANLYVSLGLLEDAPTAAISDWFGFVNWFWEFF